MQVEAVREKTIEGYRLSPQQKRLWALQCADNSPAYQLQCAVMIEGRLDLHILQRALQSVVAQHAIFRTAFLRPGVMGPIQVITKTRLPELACVNLLNVDPATQENRIKKLFEEERNYKFDLTQPPLLRSSLVALEQEKHLLLLSLPAMCADARSLQLLVREVSQAYAFCLDGKEARDDETTQYIQFSEWQNDLLEDEEADEGKAFWRNRDNPSLPVLRLPLEKAAVGGTFLPDREQFEIARKTTAHTESIARRYGASLEEFLLACWSTLIWRMAQTPEIEVASLHDGRKYREFQEVHGLFAKWLRGQYRFRKRFQFTEILRQVQQQLREADEWQEFFTWEHSSSASEAGKDYPAIGFEYEESNAPERAAGLTFTIVQRWACTDRYKVKLSCLRTTNGALVAEFHYDAALFNAGDIRRLAAEFQTLLLSATRNPEVTIDELEILGDAERKQLLVQFNDNRSPYPREACLHQLFEAQVEQTPEAIAQVYNEQSLTYRELNRRANQLAHHLQSLGVGREVCVGLCLERSPEMIVALLAILKAGGAYVPLDSSYPLERLAYMVADAQISVFVTTEELLEVLPVSWAQVVCLDTDAELIARASEQNPASEASAENLAYVMYTSGSTGEPKGVSVIHRSITRLVKETNYIDISGSDVFLQSAPISFDASTLEVWGSLLHGARLVLLAQQRPTLAELGKAISENGVTVLWLTAGLFHLMVEEQGEQLRAMRRLLAGGDVLAVEHVRKHLAAMESECRLINGYGPTENTTFTCCHVMEQNSSWQSSVPIGKPIANTEVYILDQQQQVVPVGVSGELYVGGDGLARGYLNRPELTAEKFVPHPYSERGGERLYRTGDVGRWLSDGSIEFLGRKDEQVKIRGFRIELGEIETALSRHPAVREAVVVATTLNEDKRLVAYLVSEESLDAGELRQYLKEALPEYMVPQAFVRIDQLPLTSNGKVDRAKLPAVESWGGERSSTVTVSRTPVEEVLAGIWSEVLGVAAVGVTEDFFELGGHSLLATQMMSRVREAFGVEVGLRELFERPTVKELGQSIERELREGAGVAAPPIVRVDREQELPLSFAQQRLWFIDQLKPGSAFYNVPAAVRLTGNLQVEALERTFTEVVRRHEVLRTRFADVEVRTVQVIEEPTPVELPVVDLSKLAADEREAEVRKSVKAEAEQPFDLSRGPLLRVKLLRLGEREHVVLLTMHHIVMDGWSLGIFIREIAALYEAFINDQPSPLEELPVQYVDYAYWQQEWLSGDVLDAQLSYWKRQLAGVEQGLELPPDKQRPAIQTTSGDNESFYLSEELSTQLKEVCRREDVTLFMLLLAGFNAVLHYYTGQSDIVIGTTIANRNRAETERLIGFFINTLVLRSDLSGNPTFHELLRRTRDVCLDAYAHQDLPFEKLVEELQPERRMSHTPLFQISFLLQNAPVGTLELPGLKLSAVEGGTEMAKYDITLVMQESPKSIGATLVYNSDLFEAATIQRLLKLLETGFQSVAEQPDIQLSSLVEILGSLDQSERLAERRKREESNFAKLKSINPRPVSASTPLQQVS